MIKCVPKLRLPESLKITEQQIRKVLEKALVESIRGSIKRFLANRSIHDQG